jgi:protein involved in polysaccharide export with SLBB domain
MPLDLRLLLFLPCALLSTPASAQSIAVDAAPWGEKSVTSRPLNRFKDLAVDKRPDLERQSVYQDKAQADSSPLEKMYSARVVDSLEQFGYGLFGKATASDHSSGQSLPAGAAQDDFVLSIGDELSVVMRGQRQMKATAQITSEGLLIIDDLQPIAAAGRTLGQVRRQLESDVAQLYNTDIYLSLSKVNQVNVLIAGHVKHPGRKTLTSFDTVLDALIAAGGIEKTGTLRQIRLIRDGRTMVIDLYGLLIYGSDTADFTLRNGDKIMVRPIGPTLAISGGAKRPGIYEILPALQANWDSPDVKSQRLSLNDLLDMGGGVLSTAQNRFLRMGLTSQGEESVEDVHDSMARIFGDGDILMVERGQERREGTVELAGHAHTAGLHALGENKSLADLLAEEKTLKRGGYPLIGVIERWYKTDMTRDLIAFPPMLVMAGQYDRTLMDGDIVHLFSHDDIRSLQEETINPDSPLTDPLIIAFLKERSVFVRGAVRQPGAYPVSAGATLENVLANAGGPSLEANTRNIEISRALPSDSDIKTHPSPRRLTIDLSSPAAGSTALGAGDTVRVNQKYRRVEDHHVLLIGEVRNPGTYDIMPGDTLGSLIARAGGMSDQAYPDGTILSRVSERKREEGRFKAQARDLELKLAAMLEESDPDKKPGEREISAARDLVIQLRQAEALGRITVEADPKILSENPEQDILLESGDRIYIPKRPMTVRVAGEVLSPAALQFRARTSPRDYITQAGGYTYNADKGRAFVVYPDGSAKPLSSTGFIPAGSTIVVPRDPKPFDFMDTAKDLTQILANLATTAIFSAAISQPE